MNGDDTGERVLPGVTCAGVVEVPTGREQRALSRLKAIKARVRELKRVRGERRGSMADQGRDSIDRELHDLKQEWNRWEEERRQAARERMILLGHEEGSSGCP